ncbi:hypothetical protein ACO0LC_27400 [Undibacterium sp. JH2W]|uniref:hypothetical protein n=1 Tax=Undibacterium sp. JH2W TaxID=3413037 RepID=UPI003BF250CF
MFADGPVGPGLFEAQVVDEGVDFPDFFIPFYIPDGVAIVRCDGIIAEGVLAYDAATDAGVAAISAWLLFIHMAH